MTPEVPDLQSPHKLRRLLVQRINHLSDQLAVETLRLFQELLKLPYQPIIDTLIVRNFCIRNYLDFRRIRSKSTVTTSSVGSSYLFKRNDNDMHDGSVASTENKNDSCVALVMDEVEAKIESEIDQQILQQDPQDVVHKEIVEGNSIPNLVDEAGDKEVELDQSLSPVSIETPQKELENTSKDTQNTPEDIENKFENTPKKTEIDNTLENIIGRVEKDKNTSEENNTPENEISSQHNDSKAFHGQDEISLSDSLEELNLSKGFNKRKVEKAVNGWVADFYLTDSFINLDFH